MKKIHIIALAALAASLFAVSCNKEQNAPDEPTAQQEEVITSGKIVTIKATMPEEITKVAGTYDGSKLVLAWSDDDTIVINGETFTIDNSSISVDGKTATFTGTDPGAGPYTISYSGLPGTYASQTQSEDANTEHVKYGVTLSGVDTFEDIAFNSSWASTHGGSISQSGALHLIATLPAGVTAQVDTVIIKASSDIFPWGNTLKVLLDSQTDEGSDNTLDVFATLPGSDIAIPSGTELLVSFCTTDDDHKVYTRHYKTTGDLILATGQLNKISLTCTNTAQFAGKDDDGSSEHPYLIADKYQLLAVDGLMVAGETIYFKLVDNIDMDGETWTHLNTGSGYTKAVNFNGNNKTISNLGKDLFYVFKGSIYDLTLDGSTVSARGILAEYIQGTGHEITNVTVSNGTLTSNSEKVGGLVGIINKGTSGVNSVTIDNCKVLNTGITVSNSKGNVGGLVGFIDAKTIVSNCDVYKDDAKTYTVTGANSNVGGLIGGINAVATVSDCSVSDINVTGTGVVGGVIGYSNAADVSISGCSYTGGTVTATACWCGGFVGSTGDFSAEISDCHVTNMTVTSSSDRVGGFVGQIGKNGVTVKGCSVGTELQKVAVNSSLSGAAVNMGGFVGVCYGTVTKNGSDRSKAYATITSGNSNTGTYVNLGGFVGYLEQGTIEYSDAVATLSSIKGHRVGGFAGVLTDGGVCTIDNCTANSTVTGNNYVAGFIGHATAADHVVTNNSAAGSASGAASVAGFVGVAAQGTWTKNSTSCTVTASGANSGGFAGQLSGSITVSRCSSTGSVSGSGNVCGGFTAIANNGELIKRKIEELDKTQEDFAEEIGIGDRGIRKWLKNGVYDTRTLLRLAKAFDCSVEDLICYE